MEKILLAIDALNPDRYATEFACLLARLTKSKLTGVFLENEVAEGGFVLTQKDNEKFAQWEVDKDLPAYKAKMEKIAANIHSFTEKCGNEATACRVHRDKGVPTQDLIQESRFADLIVVDSETSFEKPYKGSPTKFVREILLRSECPVVVAPEQFAGIDKIVLTYDGTASSVFAIKQFTYLFPELSTKRTIVIQVNDTGEWRGPDKDILSEWLNDHYKNLEFVALAGDPRTALFDYLLLHENIFVVMGAYARTSFSRIFKPSRAELMIKMFTHPVFIAHR